MHLSNYNSKRCIFCYADRPMLNSQCTNPYCCDASYYNVKQYDYEIQFEYYDYFRILVSKKRLYRDTGRSKVTIEFMFDLDDEIDFKKLINQIEKFEVFK